MIALFQKTPRYKTMLLVTGLTFLSQAFCTALKRSTVSALLTRGKRLCLASLVNYGVGRGAAVGCGLGVGLNLPVGPAVGVGVGVPGVAVAVGVAVGVGVAHGTVYTARSIPM
jgi:hypothetical protein